MNVKKHYIAGFSRPEIANQHGSTRLLFKNKNKIANIWERGFKSYNYGKRVLQNNSLRRMKHGKNGKFIRLLINNGWRTLSEAGIRKNPSSWIMPELKPTNAYKRAFNDNKKTIKGIVAKAVKQDIINFIKRRK